MRLLVFGADGQLGYELCKLLSVKHHVISVTRKDIDLTNIRKIKPFLNSCKPQMIINAAAYTNVELAENNFNEADLVNSKAPREIAEYCKDNDISFIHYSTDYVFDGSKLSPYVEDDEPSPCNNYGISKLNGERFIRAVDCNFCIIRCSWLFSERRVNFLRTIAHLAKSKDKISVINDNFGAPISAKSVAIYTEKIISIMATAPKFQELFHLSASGTATWYDVAVRVVDNLRASSAQKDIVLKEIHQVPSSKYKQLAKRPKNSCFNTTKISDFTKIVPKDWKQEVDGWNCP